SIFSEGLRIPVIKLKREGETDRRLLHLISNNSRDPMERELDLNVQIATNEIGRRALCKLLDREGLDHVLHGLESLMSYTRIRLANAIADLPDGSYSAEAYMDHDGLGGETRKIAVTIIIEDDHLSFDFAGTCEQARGGYNVPKNALHATCFYAAKSLLDPGLPPNAGMFDVISISAPKGTMLNPLFPAATGSRSATCQKIARAIFLAFGKLLPEEQIIAPSADMNGALVFSGTRPDGSGLFVYLETVGGGAGARSNRDGFDAVQVHITNTSNLPAEAMELEYPLMVKEYSLADTSAGAGKWRGGAGIIRDITATQDGVVASARSDGMITPAAGLNGGSEGGPARVALRERDGRIAYVSDAITNVTLSDGGGVRLETPGGGGYGPLADRPAKKRKSDHRDGFVFQD
ncbi:MAG: hydantoinase B/oxoprolinase family protein, partial [Gammaproteobacteria bacterium]